MFAHGLCDERSFGAIMQRLNSSPLIDVFAGTLIGKSSKYLPDSTNIVASANVTVLAYSNASPAINSLGSSNCNCSWSWFAGVVVSASLS